MRRMITDNQLNELKSTNLKIIKLDKSINEATITQEQLDIMFPKDEQGNIYKPDYDIIIADKMINNNGGYAYLGFWTPTKIRFNRFGTNSYYTATIGPNDTHFIQNPTSIPTYFLHNIYIKTSNLYVFLTIIIGRSNKLTINQIATLVKDIHKSCSGYLTQEPQGPITSLSYKSTDQKFYFSVNGNIDYAFFQASDVIEFSDEVTGISM